MHPLTHSHPTFSTGPRVSSYNPTSPRPGDLVSSNGHVSTSLCATG
ncbi:hypothetical protein SHJG_4772 [Streptomyces hygroscopicus subsp. jinggangensis 5008]|nr:hypothetical protein SHJG_4772 [Streptomyces hygroscopicus subsp. jinggangensis 5008]AGF64199.1 hypothetical protein SHJGH_4535 [Streptomyces hygroscopicus subsp. jinggangensis TL01]